MKNQKNNKKLKKRKDRVRAKMAMKPPVSFTLIRDVLNDKKVDILSEKLNKVYKDIPDTKGCLENISKENGCKGWCCQSQNPQVLYSEFLNAWRYILRYWSTEDVFRVIEDALNNYLTLRITKGCVLFDKESKKCKQHNTRPYNCRVYGIIPPEEFKPKMDRLREVYKDNYEVILKDQCELVSTVDNSALSIKDTDGWWKRLIEVEKIIVPEKYIHDKADGSYRTYHDHILLHIFHPDTLMDLTQVRLKGTEESKKKAIEFLMDELRNHIVEKMKGNSSHDTGEPKHECGREDCKGDCKCHSSSESAPS